MKSQSDELEQVLSSLLGQIESDPATLAVEQLTAKVEALLAAIPPGSVAGEQQGRIKSLYSLVESTVRRSHESVGNELRRVQTSKASLAQGHRAWNEHGSGDSCDMLG